MRILIVSDTHRKIDNYMEALRQAGPIDLVLHCGDLEGYESMIEQAAGCPVVLVPGNNDFFSPLPKERIFMLGNKKFWLLHGHDYYVSMGIGILEEEARSRGVDVVLFGHTHRPVVQQTDKLLIVNPGSLTYPRQEGRKPSYAIMNLDKNDDISVEIFFLGFK